MEKAIFPPSPLLHHRLRIEKGFNVQFNLLLIHVEQGWERALEDEKTLTLLDLGV